MVRPRIWSIVGALALVAALLTDSSFAERAARTQHTAIAVSARADMGKRHDHLAKERGPVRSAAIREKKKSGHAQYTVENSPPQADTRMDIDREPDPVRSLLEIRRANVMIQNWDLSCGAAALGALLRYEFGEPVTEKEIARGLMSQIGRAHV